MSGYTPVRIAYNTYEPENGGTSKSTPVIFLHGLTVAKEQWEDIPQTIANKTKRKVYAVDARNHGDSEWSDEFNFDINADDLFHFMDTVGEQKAILVGHSMGGVTAMKAALKKPERIERIVVEDMYAKKLSPEIFSMVETFVTYFQKVVQNIPTEVNEDEAKKYCEEHILETFPKELKEFFEKQQQGVKPKYFFCLKRDFNGRYINKGNYDSIVKALKKTEERQSDLTGTYDGPAHYIYGKLSIFNVPDDEENIKRFFPKAEFMGIENATHNVHGDCPEEYTEVLLKCLA